MVSVQESEMEAIRPMRESVPYSLYKSRRRPVAAEEENIFTRVSGTSAPGKCTCSVNRPMISAQSSRKPLARRMPTAVIRPMRVGRIWTTVFMPCLAPIIKLSYTFVFISKP